MEKYARAVEEKRELYIAAINTASSIDRLRETVRLRPERLLEMDSTGDTPFAVIVRFWPGDAIMELLNSKVLLESDVYRGGSGARLIAEEGPKEARDWLKGNYLLLDGLSPAEDGFISVALNENPSIAREYKLIRRGDPSYMPEVSCQFVRRY